MKALVAIGFCLVLGGVGLFAYIIFIRPAEIPEGGSIVASARMEEGGDSVVLEVPALGEGATIQPRIAFEYASHSERHGDMERISIFANYAVRTRIRVEAADGRVLLDTETVVENVRSAADPNATEGAGLFKWRPIPVSPPAPVSVRFSLLPDEEDRWSKGSLSGVALEVWRDAADVQAYHDWNAEGPTWGLRAAGVGILLLAAAGSAALRRG